MRLGIGDKEKGKEGGRELVAIALLHYLHSLYVSIVCFR